MELQTIETKIYELRGYNIMLDFDLAELYGTETKRLKEAVRRNNNRFPADFMFELTREEYHFLRTQFASLENGRGRYSKFNPYAFTEQGVAMLSSVLHSEKAIAANITIMRAFVCMRQHALSNKDLRDKLIELENKYDLQFSSIDEAIHYLLMKDCQETAQKERKPIGYK